MNNQEASDRPSTQEEFDEIQNLNANDLNVQELEERLEMAVATFSIEDGAADDLSSDCELNSCGENTREEGCELNRCTTNTPDT